MNQVTDSFSFPRFGKVLKKYISENWRQLAMGAGLVFGAMIICECLIGFTGAEYYKADLLDRFQTGERIIDPLWHQVETIFFFMLFILGSVCASMMFSGLGTKEKRIYSIMFPADQLEKYAVRFVIYVLIFPVLYLVAFYVGELVRMGLLTCMAESTDCLFVMPMDHIFILPKGELDTSNIISVLIFFAVQSAFALGSILFPKGSFVKTFVLGAVILVLFFLVVTGTSMVFTPENNRPTPLNQEQFEIMIMSIFSAIILFNYIMAYYRFKEMEVINRW